MNKAFTFTVNEVLDRVVKWLLSTESKAIKAFSWTVTHAHVRTTYVLVSSCGRF